MKNAEQLAISVRTSSANEYSSNSSLALCERAIGKVWAARAEHEKAIQYLNRSIVNFKIKPLPDVALEMASMAVAGDATYLDADLAQVVNAHVDLVNIHRRNLNFRMSRKWLRLLAVVLKIAVRMKLAGGFAQKVLDQAVADSYIAYACLDRDEGFVSDAISDLKFASEKMKVVKSEDHPAVAAINIELGWAYIASWRFSKAMKCLETAASDTQKVLGKDHPQYGAALLALGQADYCSGYWESALKRLETAADILSNDIALAHIRRRRRVSTSSAYTTTATPKLAMANALIGAVRTPTYSLCIYLPFFFSTFEDIAVVL